jgi:NNP family nitrate/nitrite transporter-like MFS transporter
MHRNVLDEFFTRALDARAGLESAQRLNNPAIRAAALRNRDAYRATIFDMSNSNSVKRPFWHSLCQVGQIMNTDVSMERSSPQRIGFPTSPETLTRRNLAPSRTRSFHLSWIGSFAASFAWFAFVPLVALADGELPISREGVACMILASLAASAIARVVVGRLCDRYGSSSVQMLLLVLGGMAVAGFCSVDFEYQFFAIQTVIGIVGASVVATQFRARETAGEGHFGVAAASATGFAIAGIAAAQIVMPLLFNGLLKLGWGAEGSWRIAMMLPAAMLMLSAFAMYFFAGRDDAPAAKYDASPIATAARDGRTWALTMICAACFGTEMAILLAGTTMLRLAYNIELAPAVAVIAAFGLMAIGTRALGGWLSDLAERRIAAGARIAVVGVFLALAGAMLITLSRVDAAMPAVICLLAFGLLLQLASGAVSAVMPLMSPDANGSAIGIAAAGSCAGAILGATLLDGEFAWPMALLMLGVVLTATSGLTLLLRVHAETDEVSQGDAQPAMSGSSPVASAA